MRDKFELVTIDLDYCDYLRKYDSKVPYNHENKKLRPFVGILFTLNSMMYFAPLSSPKPKHLKINDTIDFLKLDNGKLGAINFNNMIPVTEQVIKRIDLNNEENKKYNHLLYMQLLWMNRNEKLIRTRAKALYFDFVNGNLGKNLIDRCCNFKLLEEKCNSYNMEKTLNGE